MKSDLREAGLDISLCRPGCSYSEMYISRRAKVSYLLTASPVGSVCALEHSVGRPGEESIWVSTPGSRGDVRCLLPGAFIGKLHSFSIL